MSLRRAGTAALAASLITLAPAARVGAVRGATPPRNERPTTPELIERAERAGRLSRDLAAAYMTWAFTSPARLPAAYRSPTPWDGTLPLLQLTRVAHTLPEGSARATVRAGIARLRTLPCRGAAGPLPARAITKHFDVEYNRARLKGVRIGGFTAALETTWRTEVGGFHWPSPPRDPKQAVPGGRYLVRIQSLPPYLFGYTIATHRIGDNPATPWNDRDAYASCMVLNQDMARFTRPLRAMQATVAHEFNHSLQFGMGALTGPTNVRPVWVEGGATWMEDEVFDGSNDNYNYLSSNYPDLRTPMPLFAPSFPYPYWLVFRAMTEQYGGSGHGWGGQRIMRFFWEDLSRNAATNTDAFKAAFRSVGSTLATAYHDAGIALRFQLPCVPTAAHRPYCLEEANGYRAVHGANKDDVAAAPGAPRSGTVANDFTTLWVKLPTTGLPYPVTLTVTRGAGRLKTSIVCREGRKLVVLDIGTATSDHARSVPSYDPTACDEVSAVISDVQGTAASPRMRTLTRYTLDLGP